MRFYIILLLLVVGSRAIAQQIKISGVVKDSSNGTALPFANVIIENNGVGTVANENGFFSFSFPDSLITNKLVASFHGYSTKSQALVTGKQVYNFQLQPDSHFLNEVVVSGTMKEVSKMDSSIPVEIYTPTLFKKNPSPNIFESLTMVNGVQPQLNCNVCNTGDIHINGMEGPYTMVLIDGMPIVSSLATVYGLAGIPNSMVKRIEIVKGPASTLYGSEAVGGLINIITKDPLTSPKLTADVSGTTYNEYNVDVTAKWKIKNTTSLLGVNFFNFWNPIDNNGDNFTDITLQRRGSIFNKWSIKRKSDKVSTLALRYVYESRWGGEMQWQQKDRGSNTIYAESIFTNRMEVIGNYELPILKEKLYFDYSYNYHLQDSYYGITKYYAKQQVGFAQLRWSKKISSHDLLIGMPLRITYYDDNTIGTSSTENSNAPLKTFLPGLFVQDEVAISTKVTTLAGIRYDHHNQHGNILSPRISFKLSPNKNNTFRLSGGNGFRVVNLFTEDHAALTGAREVVIAEKLKPEQSWNVNANYVSFINLNNGYIGLDGSVFYTYFTNKIVGDFLTDTEKIIYKNINGHAVSKGVTLNADISLTNGLKFIAGITLMDVYQKEHDAVDKEIKIPQLFAPKISGTYAISYTINPIKLNIDLTGRLNGPMNLPVLPGRPDKSPWFTTMNIQLSKSFKNGFEVYSGVKNILNFVPKYPIFGPNDTDRNAFSPNFDPSYNYAPVQGIKGFLGVRYVLK